ncbi:hypothetical protein AHiyo6_15400 [Arthrobacter sp. Hiyo6]|jgi:hypothetical protein|nr:hypothetical protein AHiyo6_15400 [Arthrobacter sp. Hiyo6]
MYNAQASGATLAATGFVFVQYALAAWVLVLAGAVLFTLAYRSRKPRH